MDSLEKLQYPKLSNLKKRILTRWDKASPSLALLWHISSLPWNMPFSSPYLTRKTKFFTTSLSKIWLAVPVSSSADITKQERPKSEIKRWEIKEKKQRCAKKSWDIMQTHSISGPSCKICQPVHLEETSFKLFIKFDKELFGEKIMLATPLLKWYLNHGLEVTHIHKVVEYSPVPCFQAVSNELEMWTHTELSLQIQWNW